MESKIKSHKFGIVDLLREGWQLYRANFTNIFLVVLCVYIPINIILSFVPMDTLIQAYGTQGLQIYNSILNLLQFLIGTIATVGIASIVEKSIQGFTLSWGDALRYGLSKWTSAIGTGLLGGLIILGLTLLLIVPGIIWSLYYFFWVYVVALRNVNGKAALDYSKSLVKGQWWRVFGIGLVLGIIALVIGLMVSIPLNQISDNPFFLIIPNTISSIVGAYFTVVTIVFFLNNDYLLRPAQVEQNIPPMNLPEAENRQ